MTSTRSFKSNDLWEQQVLYIDHRESEHRMISRVWHGWTTIEQADAYETLLTDEIFPGIQQRQIAGYHGIELFRRTTGLEVEFVTIMYFDSLDAIREFAGQDYEVGVVPVKARALLSRFDERSQHYEVKASSVARQDPPA